MSNKQVTRISAYALLVQDARILLCRIRANDRYAPTQWTLPGGGIDFGEDPAAAMVREVYEETGLHVRPTALVDIDSLFLEEPGRHFHGIRILYTAEILGGTLTNEIDGTTDLCQWHTRPEANALPLVNLAQAALDLAFS